MKERAGTGMGHMDRLLGGTGEVGFPNPDDGAVYRVSVYGVTSMRLHHHH